MARKFSFQRAHLGVRREQTLASLIPLISLSLAITAILVSANSLSAFAETVGAPIPGYTFRDGAYQPNESYRGGQPRLTGLHQPFSARESVAGNAMTPSKGTAGQPPFCAPRRGRERNNSIAD